MATHILVERLFSGGEEDNVTYEAEYEVGCRYCTIRKDGAKTGCFRVDISTSDTLDQAQAQIEEILEVVSLPVDVPHMGNLPLRGVKIARSLCAGAEHGSEYVRGVAEFLCDFTDGLTQDDKEAVIRYITVEEMYV